MSNEGYIARASETPSIWLLRDHLTPLIGPHHTGGNFALAVAGVHPGDGPPPHIHRREDEAFYVLEGEMTFLAGEQLIVAPAGSFLWGPRDLIHCFKCTSKTPARQVLFVTPTAFLEFAMTLAEPAPDFLTPPELGPDKIGKLMTVAPQYGIEMKMDHALPTVIVPSPAPTKRLWCLGEDVSFLATSAQTGGKFTFVEIRSAPGGGPPPHAHTGQDEAFFVAEGKYDVEMDGRTETIGQCDAVFIPRGCRHRYTCREAGKLISIHTPGGFENFFEDVGVPHQGEPTAPAAPDVAPDQMIALLARHGMTA